MQIKLSRLLRSPYAVSRQTRATMRAVRSQGNRSTEWRLRATLVRAGIRGWCVQPALPERPDFLFAADKLAIFVDGCFWHSCGQCGHLPRTRSGFWREKFQLTKVRDDLATRSLQSRGYRVLRLWEHELVEPTKALRRIRLFLNSNKPSKARSRMAGRPLV